MLLPLLPWQVRRWSDASGGCAGAGGALGSKPAAAPPVALGRPAAAISRPWLAHESPRGSLQRRWGAARRPESRARARGAGAASPWVRRRAQIRPAAAGRSGRADATLSPSARLLEPERALRPDATRWEVGSRGMKADTGGSMGASAVTPAPRRRRPRASALASPCEARARFCTALLFSPCLQGGGKLRGARHATWGMPSLTQALAAQTPRHNRSCCQAAAPRLTRSWPVAAPQSCRSCCSQEEERQKLCASKSCMLSAARRAAARHRRCHRRCAPPGERTQSASGSRSPRAAPPGARWCRCRGSTSSPTWQSAGLQGRAERGRAGHREWGRAQAERGGHRGGAALPRGCQFASRGCSSSSSSRAAPRLQSPAKQEPRSPAPLSSMPFTKSQVPLPCCSSRMRPPGLHTRAISCAGRARAARCRTDAAQRGCWCAPNAQAAAARAALAADAPRPNQPSG